MQVFAAGGAGETATFVIRESNGQTGTVQYKLNGNGDFLPANNTPVELNGVTSITIKAIPAEDAKVNQNNSGISGTERTETFDYDALITESGWTYNIQDNDGNITFTIEFDNNDGTGGGSNPGGGENPGENVAFYSVDFGTGSWIVGDVTVTADKSGEQTLSESDIITLTGFDAETMEVRVVAEDGFSTTLAVNNNQTSISAKTNDGGVPTDIAFSVGEKFSEPGGGGNDGGEAEGTYTVWFGEGSWEIGDVTVTTDRTDVQYLTENDIITLQNFDAETMEARVDAEDGFWTILAVTDGQTSIFAHTNDGGVPTDIAFSVVEKSSNPGGGGEMPGGNSDVVKIQIGNSSPGANGTVMYKFDIDEEFTSVTSTQADAGGNILVAIPGEATSITIKAVPNDDYTVRRGGCRLYVDDENVINEDNINTYYDALIGDGYEFSLLEGLPVFVVDFGEPEIDLWYAISWGGGNVTVENGQIMYHRVYVGDVTYTTISEEVNESSNIYAIDTIEGDMEACLRTYGVAIVGGTDLFVMPDVSDVYVEFVLVPDYGYQVTDIITNETESLLNEFNPIEQISTYKFKYITNTNVHFNVMFSETEDIINVGSGNTNITGGAISGGENIIDTGNLQMDVDEVDKNTVSNIIKEEVGDFDAIFLNIDLNQIVSKGAGRGNWTTPLTELENEVTISLDVAGYDSNKIYYIIREHDGTCDRLEATYNTTTGKLEFATDKFSTYAIICTDAQTSGGEDNGGGEGENVYYIDLGTGSWTVGDVTVSAPEGMSGVVSMLDTETIPTEMLANFDSETMDITLTTGDGFVIYLEIDENGNTTLASTRDGVELPPYGETLTFAVVEKPGNMEIVDKTEENACDTALEEKADVLLEKLGLSATEVARIENGENIQVWIEATDISATVSQTDKDLIDSKKGNTTIGMYLDIDLLKQIGSDSPVNITETNGAVTITLKVPSSLINSNSSVTRTYQMIRVHNGVATVIPCTYNAANQTISCETDQFSTYALAYVDQQNNSGGGNTGGGNTDGGNAGGGSTDSGNTGGGSSTDGSNNNVKDEVPKTGDASNAYIWFILALVSGIGALYFGKKGLVLKKEN